eukprot:Skav224312  [mRNA]  locus=scaffold227:333682:334692:+ [translate_table: standard]
MDNNTFVQPDVQCPKKPRGRKKAKKAVSGDGIEKASSSSSAKHPPSAASCGFSTAGMSLKEIMEKLKEQKQQQPETEPIHTETKSKKSRKAKSMVAGSEQASGPDTKHTEIEVTKCENSKNHRKRATETEPMPSNPATKTAKRIRKKGPAAEPAQTEPLPSHPGTKQSKRKSKRAKAAAEPAQEEVELEHPQPKRKRSRAASATSNQQAEITPTEATTPPATEVETEAEVARAARQASAKAKASRKSSAYHKAVAAAKRNGASKEEQVEAGKAVACLVYIAHGANFAMQSFSYFLTACMQCMRMCVRVCLCVLECARFRCVYQLACLRHTMHNSER